MAPSSAPPPVPGFRDDARNAFLLALIAMAAYLITLRNGFVFDDRMYVLGNPWIRSWANLWPLLTSSEANAHVASVFWRPLRNLHYLVDHSIAGLHPAWFHAMNLLWHGLATAGAYALVRRLGLPAFVAVVTGVVFGLHPAQSEAVAWVKERDGLMASAFLLWGIAVALGARWRHVWGGLALVAAALLSKENAVVLLVLLPAAHFAAWRLRGELPGRAMLAVQGVGVALLVASFMVIRHRVVGMSAQVEAPMGGTMAVTLWTMCGVFLRYIQVVVYPVGLELFYHYLKPSAWLDPLPIAGVATLLAAGVFVLAGAWRAPAAAFGVLWFVTALMPYSNLLPMMQWMAVRFLHLPMLGPGILLGLALEAWRRQGSGVLLGRPLAEWGLGILAAGLFAASVGRAVVWQSDLTLWRDGYLTNPKNLPVVVGYADELVTAGEHAEALRILEQAGLLRPETAKFSAVLWKARLLALQGLGRTQEALDLSEDALSAFPQDAFLHNLRGILQVALGDRAGAIATWEALLAQQPFHTPTMRNLVTGLREAGDDARAAAWQARLEELQRLPRAQWQGAAERWQAITPHGS